MALPASKAFNESRPRRLRRPCHLMSLVLPRTAAGILRKFGANGKSGDFSVRALKKLLEINRAVTLTLTLTLKY